MKMNLYAAQRAVSVGSFFLNSELNKQKISTIE